jgi:hypothetical protein
MLARVMWVKFGARSGTWTVAPRALRRPAKNAAFVLFGPDAKPWR